ncbi:twin-arginine translocation signal domain-containing protein [Rufibacter tibetensis]|uniref:Uncharacterized protein n=1 Tax=Rufibacter tibetensis TaxID=512763 RepID=A0A0P0CZD7_9BACT|nr:twin-arginine translocation signal domain-containing protein [Rufibacter tibetensis]ALI99897.1 hypothetical protein DC20_14100 [Rufibacter tibetensis]
MTQLKDSPTEDKKKKGNMNRRSFLKLTGLAGAALITLPSLGYVYTSNQDAAVGIILDELKYLKLDKKGVEQFVQNYFQNHYVKDSLRAQINLKSIYFLDLNIQKSEMVTKMVQDYLLSTDFFMNKMDETKTVKYMGVYTPYKRPCANPFSSFYYPQVST